jgi:hypothetical protein
MRRLTVLLAAIVVTGAPISLRAQKAPDNPPQPPPFQALIEELQTTEEILLGRIEDLETKIDLILELLSAVFKPDLVVDAGLPGVCEFGPVPGPFEFMVVRVANVGNAPSGETVVRAVWTVLSGPSADTQAPVPALGVGEQVEVHLPLPGVAISGFQATVDFSDLIDEFNEGNNTDSNGCVI